MGVLAFPVIAGAQVTKTDTTPVHEPGTIMMVRNGTSITAQRFGLVEYVRFEAATDKGDAMAWLDSSDTERVEIASVAIGRTMTGFRGVAAATVAASSYGWIYIHGYVPAIRLGTLVASGARLTLSGSTAGRWSEQVTANFNATAGVVSTTGTYTLNAPMIALGAGSNAAASTIAGFLCQVWG